MAAPTFINAYSSVYDTTGSSKTISVTTQAGDTLIVYGGGDTDGTNPVGLSTPTGNGVSLTLLQSIAILNRSSAFIWSGIDGTGGTNWTMSCNADNTIPVWGFTCVVFRNAGGSGASNSLNAFGAPTLGLTTTKNNSAIVVFNNDYTPIDGASRVWDTVNGITPTAGNGLELTYDFNGNITVYGAYYNDAGAAGADTVGLSAPTGQTYSIVAAEVLPSAVLPVASVPWVKA